MRVEFKNISELSYDCVAISSVLVAQSSHFEWKHFLAVEGALQFPVLMCAQSDSSLNEIIRHLLGNRHKQFVGVSDNSGTTNIHCKYSIV